MRKWQASAETAWKDYGERGETSAALLEGGAEAARVNERPGGRAPTATPTRRCSKAASLPPACRTTIAAHRPGDARALPLARALALANRAMVGVGMLALLAASVVLTSSVVTRYLFKASTDWQDETAVFCWSARPSSAAPSCSRSAAMSASRRCRRSCRSAPMRRVV